MAERKPTDDILILGAAPARWGDWYQTMLRAPWWVALGAITVAFLFLNLLFAFAYQIVGGVTGARSFADHFFFSVETMGTIGYGEMSPSTTSAHLLVTCEAIAGILVVALATGLVFSKFSLVRARVRFSEVVVIAPMNGIPTLMIRVGNERESRVIDACTRVVFSRRELTHEGVEMWRLHDLALERERAPALSRAWMIMHRITPGSPLDGCSSSSLEESEAELFVSISGIDETSGQTLHAQQTYEDKHIRWNVRHADLIDRRADGGFTLDLSRFDQLTACDVSSALRAEAPREVGLGRERAPE